MTSSSDPRRWGSTLLAAALTVLAAAVALSMAVHLVVAIAPVLIGLGITAAVVYLVHRMNELRRSRW
jgi:hypothetical protein